MAVVVAHAGTDTGAQPAWRYFIADTAAELPTSGYGITEGDLGYAEDTDSAYRWNGSAWAALITSAATLGTVNQVAFFTATNVIGGDAGMTYDATANKLSLTDSSTALTPIHELFQASTGDTGTRWTLSGAASYMAGIDNSDSDKWKVSYGATGNAALGTNDYLTIGTDGEVIVPQWFQCGTATDPTGQGDGVFGLLNANRIWVSSVNALVRNYRTSADASGVLFDCYKSRSGGSLNANDIIGQFRWIGLNSTPAEISFANLRCTATNITAASETGIFQFFAYVSGTEREYLRFGGGVATFDFNSAGLPIANKAWYNGGTVTDATEIGDWASGLTGANRFNYDQSDGDIENIFGASTAYRVSGVQFTATASATISNSVTEATLIGSGVGTLTIPVNYLRAGRGFRIRAWGIYKSNIGAPGTLNVRVKLGSTTVHATGDQALPANTTSKPWRLDCLITCRTAGATGTVFGSAVWEHQEVAVSSDIWWDMGNATTTTIDTTATQAIDVTGDFSVADAQVAIECYNVSIEALN